jgi:hypothetical protein
MNQAVNTRSYDIFKAVVALILLIILIWLLLSGAPGAAPTSALPSATSSPPGAAQLNPTVPQAATASPQPPSPTPTLKPTETSLPTPTRTAEPTRPPTPTVAPTATPQTSPEPTKTPTPAQATVSCPLALPPRLKVGDTARVVANLNMRSTAGIGNNLILTNPVGTQLTILGGPVCEPYQGGAYLWWQVKLSDGQAGWSAEGSITGKFYFLEPVK